MINYNRLSTTLSLLGFVFLISCSSEDQQPETLPILQIPEILQLGTDIEGNDDLFVGIYYYTVVDSENNIYSFDPTQDVIFKFSPDGTFIQTIGGPGRGPGEFQSVYAMNITPNDQLFVYDYMGKQATLFNPDGTIGKIYPIDLQYALSDIGILNDKNLLLPHFTEENVIMVFDLETGEVKDELVPIADVKTYGVEYEHNLLRQFPGMAINISDDIIVYTPTYYNGRFKTFSKENDTWVRGDDIEGYEAIDRPFTIHHTIDEPHERAYGITIHPEGNGYLGFELHSHSMGLFPLNDGGFAHISLRDADEEKTEVSFIIEVFSKDGTLAQFGEIDGLRIPYPPEVMPLRIDGNGLLYVTDIRDEPILRIFDLNNATL